MFADRANQVLVDLLGAVAARNDATPAQIALAWLLAQKPWVVPIPGTRRVERLEENLGGAQVTLTAGELAEAPQAAAVDVHGERYPETDDTSSLCGELATRPAGDSRQAGLLPRPSGGSRGEGLRSTRWSSAPVRTESAAGQPTSRHAVTGRTTGAPSRQDGGDGR